MSAMSIYAAVERLQAARDQVEPTGDSVAARNVAARVWAARNPEIAVHVVALHPARKGGMVPVAPPEIVWWYLASADLTANRDGLSILADARAKHAPRPFRPVNRASLPRIHRAGDEDAVSLPAFVGSGPSVPVDRGEAYRPPYLPGFEPAAEGCPSWLLALYDRAGGESMAQGRGAPWDLRLFVAALCAVPIDQRTGDARPMPFGIGEVIAWLHPDGWRNRRRDWDRLPAALNRLGSLRVPIGNYDVALVHALAVPRRWDPAEIVTLQVRVPATAAAGIRLDWDRLRRYGAESAAVYRAYLSVCAAMDRSAYHGAPLVRQIGAPVLDAAGTLKRGRRGRLVRDRDNLVRNPKADLAPVWTDADAARFLGFDASDRFRRRDARRALERLEADGAAVVERLTGGRFRLFGPER